MDNNEYVHAPPDDNIRREQFSIRWYPAEKRKVSEAACLVGLDMNNAIRQSMAWVADRVINFHKEYPDADITSRTLDAILKHLNTVSDLAYQKEYKQELERLERMEKARIRDGGKINYRANRKALDFYLEMWNEGMSPEELLAAYEKEVEWRLSEKLDAVITVPAVQPVIDTTAKNDDEVKLVPVGNPAAAVPAPMSEVWLPDDVVARLFIVGGVIFVVGGVIGFLVARMLFNV